MDAAIPSEARTARSSMRNFQLFIDGKFVDPQGGEWFDSVDPFRGAAWARIPRAQAVDVGAAVTAAKRAMTEGKWAHFSATMRGGVLRKIGDLVSEHAERLAEIEVRDNGKLLAEMRG